MHLNLFKKICLTVMGVGLVSSVVSVGTFASFTAMTTNPSNTFAAGTLNLTNTTTNVASLVGPNITLNAGNPAPRNAECSTATGYVASACSTVFASSQVTGYGLEPLQYYRTKVTLKNNGTLPATIGVQLQNLEDYAGGATPVTSSPYLGAAYTSYLQSGHLPSCPGDLANQPAGAPTTGHGACTALGSALNITVQDDRTAPSASTQCIYGQGGASPAAPTGGSISTGTLAAVSSACDNITATGSLASQLGHVQTAGDAFGGTTAGGSTADASGTTAPNVSFFNLGKYRGASSGYPTIWIPGSSTSGTSTGKSLTTATTIAQWAPGETHDVTITLAFPDTGTTSRTDGNGDVYAVGNEVQFQGGAVAFDLVWVAFQ